MDWFSLKDELSNLEDDKTQKLAQIKERCGNDDSLNFFKLTIYKWDLNDAVKYYKNDKFCWDYCINQKCNNTTDVDCKYTHDRKMIVYYLMNTANKSQDYMDIVYLCEYLLCSIKYSNDPIVHYVYAKAHRKLRNNDLAEILCAKSIESDPNADSSHNLYAEIMMQYRKNFEARIHFQKAIDMNPSDVALYLNMGYLLGSKMGDYTQSLSYLSKGSSLDNKNGNVTFLMGEAYYHLNEWILAKNYYQKTLKF